MPVVSVIVPVYNVEKYIHRCVDSILAQTFTDFELILVDDGSPDNCPAICDEYAEKDSRIRVIHQENGGLSAARNAGLDVATGEYISFVDSDDWVESGFLMKMASQMNKDNSQMVVSGARKIWPGKVENNKVSTTDICIDRDKAVSLLARPEWVYFVAWNKLYHRGIFANIRFPEDYIHEDEFVIHRVYNNCGRISLINDVLYNYRQLPDSIMGKGLRIHRTDKLSALAERITYAGKEKWGAVCNYACNCYVHYFFDYYFHFPRSDENQKYFDRMDNSLRIALPYILRSREVSLRHKLYLLLIRINPHFFTALKKWFGE